jgi:endonuclease/exonuclease/phosphatase family metal-dependent hydrolase
VLETYTGGGGGGVMARWPDLRYAGHQEPSGPAQPEAGASVPGVGRLNVKAVHPFVPTSRSGVRQWRAQLGRLPAAMEDGVPHILAGDFNATLDHSVVRDAIARGYVDAADAVGAGWKPTFPVAPWGRRRPPITLDHILVPKDWRVRAFSVHTLRGSDHKTVIAELQAP